MPKVLRESQQLPDLSMFNLMLEGYDKNSRDYYKTLNNRLRKLYPELISGKDDEVGQTKPRVKAEIQ